MSPTKLASSILRIIVVIIALYLVASSWGLLTTVQNLITPCNFEAPLLQDKTRWQIASSTLPAQIIWQKTESTLHPIAHIGLANTGFVASDGKVIYWQISGGLPCDKSPIIAAFDETTGGERWRYRPGDIITKIFAIHDGYILLDVSGITKLNEQGHSLWQQSLHLPFRDLETMYEMGDILFFPDQYEKTYEVSSKTGDVIGSQDLGAVMGMFDHFALVISGSNSETLMDLTDNQRPIYTINFPTEKFQNVHLNPIFPFAMRSGSLLFFNFDSTSFEIHDFQTGQLLWQSEKPMSGVPALMDGILAVYSPDNRLELYDSRSGKDLGNIVLQTSDNNSTNNDGDSRFSTWITADQDTIFIRQLDTLELIALKLDLSQFHLEQ